VSSAAVQDALLEQLRQGKINKGEIRAAIGCSAAELAGAIQALRYAGKVKWECLELSPSMAANGGGEDPPQQSAGVREPAVDGPEGAPSSGPDDEEGGGAADATLTSPPSNAGPDDEEDDGVNDAAPSAPRLTRHTKREVSAPGGWTKASNIAGTRPVPVPAHEPEIARLVREESTAIGERRRQARSTGTVRQPLELKKFGVPDMDLSEALSSMLSDTPQSIMRAVQRKHPLMWRRCILLSRELGKSPMQALYDALEAGLDQLEPHQEEAA
jgi:hypothetical protein